MAKALIGCPTCENKGIRQILGELDPDGNFVIMRFHNGFTKIRGSEFEVICDKCNEPTFFRRTERREDGAMSNNGVKRVFGFGTEGGTIAVGV